MLKTTKVYIDSRYAVRSSGPSIEYQIPGGLDLRPNTRIWLSEFTCVAAWDTIDASNDRLYVIEGAVTRVIHIPHGVYELESLRVVLQDELNNASKTASMGVYDVRLKSTGTTGGTHRVYEVSCSFGLFGLPAGGYSSLERIMSFPTGATQSQSHVSGFIDLRRVHSLYIHSTSFAAYNSMGPRNERSIIAKVPVTVGYGGLVTFLSSGSEHDYIEAGVSAISSIQLQLKDAAGELLSLNNTHWSCTLLFEQ
jgi:hypothetical protein